jgi:hypothetical protein
MAAMLKATTAHKEAGQTSTNLNNKAPPQGPDLAAELMMGMCKWIHLVQNTIQHP